MEKEIFPMTEDMFPSIDKVKRLNPVNRNNFFFSDESYDFEVELGLDYVMHDLNQTVVLYQVDLEKTSVNNVYKEAKKENIVFKTPVEINVIYEIKEPEMMSYDTKKIKAMFQKTGKLDFTVYEKTLKDNECDIKRGDYIGVQITPEHMEYFTVTDDGKINYDNKHMMYGRLPYYRTISCASIYNNEIVTENS